MRRQVPVLLAAMALLVALSAPAAAQGLFQSYEDAEFEPCTPPGGAWAGEEPTTAYVRDAYYDFDKHFRAEISRIARAGTTLPRLTGEERKKRWDAMHDDVAGLIARLGRLLPRMNRPLDLAPMMAQMREGAIWPARGGHHTELLGIAVAREMLGIGPDAGARVADFIDQLDVLESLLFGLESIPDGSDARKAAEAAEELSRRYRDGAYPVFKQAVLAPDLGERLKTRVVAACGELAGLPEPS